MYLDVIFNEETIYQARLDEYAKEGGRIPSLPIKESGWLVVRVSVWPSKSGSRLSPS